MNTSLKNTVAVLFFTFCIGVLQAQKVQFDWAKQINGDIYSSHGAIIHDHLGNVYTVGNFSGTIDFDPGPGIFNLISSSPLLDIYISKLDATGNFLWVKQIKIGDYVDNTNIVTDASGDVYITGSFQSTIDFDPGPGIYNLITDSLCSDAFVLKLNASGNFIWAKQFKGNGYTQPTSIALDALGNILVFGYFTNTTDFDPGINSYNFKSAGLYDIFISKLDSSGIFIWAKQIGGGGFDLAGSIFIDSKGYIYTTGLFEGTVDFDPGPGVYNLTRIGPYYNIFASKFDGNGNFLWARQIGGDRGQSTRSIVADGNGNVYLGGLFLGTVDFDPGPGIFDVTSSGTSAYRIGDIFLLKLDAAGNFMWVKNINTNCDWAFNLSLDALNGIYIAGPFRDTIDLDPGTGTYKLVSRGLPDIFIGELNSSGEFLWAKQIGGSWFVDHVSLSADSVNIYATGQFANTVDFDPDSGTYNLSDTGRSTFILKWDKCYSYLNITNIACDSFVLNNQSYRTSGKYVQVLKNHKGCDSTIILNLTIIKSPKAKFILQSQAGCQYVEYIFTDSSFADTVSAAGYTYTWDFGDGTTSKVNSKTRIPNIKHVYTKGGTYTVRLLFDNGFCSDTFTIINSVFILPAPKPGFTINSHNGCTPFALNIKDTLTTDIVLKEYDFGNGFVALKNNKVLDTTIQINTSGTHIIQQRLTGTTGCITQFSDSIYITNGLTKSDTVHVLYTTVLDSNTTFTQWNILPNAISYTIKNKNTTDTFFTDKNVQPYLSSLHYFVNAMDSCGNKSAVSPVTQTIYLKGENENFNEFALLDYTPYETWKEGVLEYQIEYFDNISQLWKKLDTKQGKILSAHADILPNSSNFNITKAQICYRVIAIEKKGNAAVATSTSNVACVPVYPVVFLPNAFSPNGDGINEYYKPICAGLNNYIFEIYDRWGQLVYSDTPESKGWDGTFRGRVLLAGAYVYRLSAMGFLKSSFTSNARVVERKGTLFLIR